MKAVGFIGLGIMGKPMLRNLIRSGYSVTAYDIVPEFVETAISYGAVSADSCAMVASVCDIVITMLPDSPQVKEAVLGENGVLSAARPGAVVVDMSSISPIAAQEIAARCAEKGVTYLDCPVSGGEPKAVDGTLSIMCGGPEDAFESIKPLLSCMGSSVALVGDVGSGNMTKLANQIIVAVNIAAMGEAMALAAKAGVDPKKVYEAIKGGLAGSTVLNAKMPMVLDRNFKPGFRIALHIKDLNNAVAAAQTHRVPLPLTEHVLGMMNSLRAQGKDGLDHSALVQIYEQLGDVTIAQR